MECVATLRVSEYNFRYPGRRIPSVVDADVCSCNSYLSSCEHNSRNSKFYQRVSSFANNGSNNHDVNFKQYLKSPRVKTRTLHEIAIQRILILALLLIFPFAIYASDINAEAYEESREDYSLTDSGCFLLGEKTVIKCTRIANLSRSFHSILQNHNNLSTIHHILIADSNLSSLNLSEFIKFSELQSISITNCSVSSVAGSIPETLLHLNVSSNIIKSINNSVFGHNYVQRSNYSTIEQSRENETHLKLRTLDLSHNKLIELPPNIFQLKDLETLKIYGNAIKCNYVWENLSKWYIMSGSRTSILVDAEDAECRVSEDVDHFQYSVLSMLKAKKEFEEICDSLNKDMCHGCKLHGLQRPINSTSKKGISISLSIDCSSRNLTEMPDIPWQTWELNVSNNNITDLGPMKTNVNYTNLVLLHAESNQVDIETLPIGSPFLNKFSYLGLRQNRITSLPPKLLLSIMNITGEGKLTLGDNNIHCDCDTAREVKPLLVRLTERIKDIGTINCENAHEGKYLLVKDLLSSEFCKKDSSTGNEFWFYVLIVMEVLLIFGVITKVWYDQRTFRQTGVLPWCSAKMPRLPCDAMLEGLKDPPHYNNNNGHHQLQSSQREIRSGSSCTNKSGKSSRSSSAQSSSV